MLPWSMHDFNTSTVVERHAFDLLHTQHVAVVWRRSLTQALTIVIQTGLDAGAAYGAFSLAGFLGAAETSRCTTSGALPPHFWAATSVSFVTPSMCSCHGQKSAQKIWLARTLRWEFTSTQHLPPMPASTSCVCSPTGGHHPFHAGTGVIFDLFTLGARSRPACSSRRTRAPSCPRSRRSRAPAAATPGSTWLTRPRRRAAR